MTEQDHVDVVAAGPRWREAYLRPAGALLVLVWRRGAGRWAGAFSSILGGIFLVFGQLGARHDFDRAAGSANGGAAFHDRFGYWLTLAAFALAAAMCALPGRRRG
jgi:hypothetical protein